MPNFRMHFATLRSFDYSITAAVLLRLWHPYTLKKAVEFGPLIDAKPYLIASLVLNNRRTPY